MKVAAIIPAAGSGQRMGGVRKAFMSVAGKPMLRHSIDVFLSHPRIALVVVALAEDDVTARPDWLIDPRIQIVRGGAHRADSVRAGLSSLSADIDSVIVHDAARPLITTDLIDRVLAQVAAGRGATVAIPVTDTLHEVDGHLDISETPERMRFWRAQTPQAFPRAILETAFKQTADASVATDEAGMVAEAGYRVRVVPGEPWNIKVTTPEDIVVVEAALRERAP